MTENRGLDVVNISYSNTVVFTDCKIENNKNIRWSVFESYASSYVSIENSIINNNSVHDKPYLLEENVCVFLSDESLLHVYNTTVINNNIIFEYFGNVEFYDCIISENAFK